LLLLSISPSLRANTFRATTNNARTWIPAKHFANNPRKNNAKSVKSISKKKNCSYIKIAPKECLKNCSNQLYLTNYNLSVKLKGLMQHAPSKQEQEDKED